MKRVITILAICLGWATAVANPLDSLTIKPIAKLESAIVVDTLPTADKSLSAHYENTIVITADGVLVLTEVERGL